MTDGIATGIDTRASHGGEQCSVRGDNPREADQDEGTTEMHKLVLTPRCSVMLWGRSQVVALVVMASSVVCMTRTAINRVIICSYDHMHRSAKGSRYQMRMDVWEGLLAGESSIIWGTHHQSHSNIDPWSTMVDHGRPWWTMVEL